jgi:hypothetical protein
MKLNGDLGCATPFQIGSNPPFVECRIDDRDADRNQHHADNQW